MSADDLRINLWHLEVTSQCFNIVDMKPADMGDLVGDSVVFFLLAIRSSTSSRQAPSVYGNTSKLGTDTCVRLLDDEPEVITTAEFHPSFCSLLAYGSSSGLVRLVDLRRSALCDQSVRT